MGKKCVQLSEHQLKLKKTEAKSLQVIHNIYHTGTVNLNSPQYRIGAYILTGGHN
jgi:hypothetical protein